LEVDKYIDLGESRFKNTLGQHFKSLSNHLNK